MSTQIVSIKGISVKILNKDYQVSCPEGSESQLYDSASYLDQKMRDIRQTGRVVGVERIAIMAALNIINELLTYKQQKDDYVQTVSHQIERLQLKIDEALLSNPLPEYPD